MSKTDQSAEILKDFSTCEISDAIVKLGDRTGGLIPNLEIYSPNPSAESTQQMRIAGPAYTVERAEVNQSIYQLVSKDLSIDDYPVPAQHFADSIVRGSVVVVQGRRDIEAAVWGGLMTARAQSRGAIGLIVSGRVRDLNEHRSAEFPVFACGHSTLPQGAAMRPYKIQEVLNDMGSISTKHSVSVRPRDIIVADIDGVVVIPLDKLEKVAELCEKIRSADTRCMADLKAGYGVQETFKKHRG